MRVGAVIVTVTIVLTRTIVIPSLAADAASVGRRGEVAPTFRLDFEAAHFEGDFGADEEVRLDVFTTRLRWRWSRGELRVGLPLLRLAGEATLVGGVPTPGRRGVVGEATEPPGPPFPDEPGAMDTLTETGPGDVRVRADFDLIRGSARRPWLNGLAEVKLPTAEDSAGLGTGEADVEGGLVLVFSLGKTNLFLEGRYASNLDMHTFLIERGRG